MTADGNIEDLKSDEKFDEEVLVAAAFDDVAYWGENGRFYTNPADPRVLVFTDVDRVREILNEFSKAGKCVYPESRRHAIKSYCEAYRTVYDKQEAILMTDEILQQMRYTV